MIDPGHPGAIHVVTHVLEMRGRAREGLAFLAATESAWAEGTGFSVHLAWHRALFQLDMGTSKSLYPSPRPQPTSSSKRRSSKWRSPSPPRQGVGPRPKPAR